MKNIIKLILFLIYTIGIFLIQSPLVILWGMGINFICMILSKVQFKRAIRNLWSFMGFILFTWIVNVFVVEINYATIIAAKLMIVCNITYIFASKVSYSEFAEMIVQLLAPLKLFKVNTKDFGIMICVALAFIPILKQELTNIRLALKAKGSKIDTFHLMLRFKEVLVPMLSSVLNRMGEVENSLKSKAYEES